MFYPKFIYENLPYLYLLVSGYLIAYFDNWGAFVSAALFYFAGCIILVTRSDHRRTDKKKIKKKNSYTIPTIVYEYLPYCYCAIALVLLLKTNHVSLQFLAIVLMIFALRNLLCRGSNRRKAKSLF